MEKQSFEVINKKVKHHLLLRHLCRLFVNQIPLAWAVLIGHMSCLLVAWLCMVAQELKEKNMRKEGNTITKTVGAINILNLSSCSSMHSAKEGSFCSYIIRIISCHH